MDSELRLGTMGFRYFFTKSPMRLPLHPWIHALLLAGGTLAAGAAPAGTMCAPTARPGVEQCVSGLPMQAVQAMREAQSASNWCWAAAVSMVLRHHGVAVSQEQVAQAHLGAPDNEKASPEAITALLNRRWTDAATGRSVDVEAAPQARWWRLQGLAAPDVLDDLHHDRPLVLAVRGHAMVLVQVVYERSSAAGVRLLRAVVVDSSAGGGWRDLRASEGQLDYVAHVQARGAPEQHAAR
jgi:hypothetical protein